MHKKIEPSYTLVLCKAFPSSYIAALFTVPHWSILFESLGYLLWVTRLFLLSHIVVSCEWVAYRSATSISSKEESAARSLRSSLATVKYARLNMQTLIAQ